jgi:uncharacterized membrane protein HdeD (DUF308 family)
MDDIARDVARQSVPWKEGQSWWLVGIEGVVALLVGIYIVADPNRASEIIRWLIAIVLLVVSLEQIFLGFRARGLPTSPWAALRGGVGATAAVLALLADWSDTLQRDGARQILAVGLLAYGILGLISLIFTLRTTGFKVAAIITDLLTIGLGLVLLTADPDDESGTQLLGAVAIIGGVALLIYAYMLWSRSRAAA